MVRWAWAKAVTAGLACAGFAAGQAPPTRVSVAPPAHSSPPEARDGPRTGDVIALRTTGQPERKVKVLRLTRSDGGEVLADLQDQATGARYTVPARMLSATPRPTAPPARPVLLHNPTRWNKAPRPSGAKPQYAAPHPTPKPVTYRPPARPRSMPKHERPAPLPTPAVKPRLIPARIDLLPPSPLGGEGPGVRGLSCGRGTLASLFPRRDRSVPPTRPSKTEGRDRSVPPTRQKGTPHPQPLSPKGRGETDTQSTRSGMTPVPPPVIAAPPVKPLPYERPLPPPVAPPPIAPRPATEFAPTSAPAPEVRPAGLFDPVPMHVAPPVPAATADPMADETGPYLRDLFGALRPSVRERAATALAECRYGSRPEVQAQLVKAASDDPSPDVRAHCVRLLSKLGYHESRYLDELAGWAESGSPPLKQAARDALARLAVRN